ncbi:MAG: outer membrane lipoprotein-sorting protein [Bacteroidales bacterium]
MKRNKITGSFLILLMLAAVFLNAQNAETLLKNMDDLMSAPKDKQAIVEITVTKKSDKEKIREAIMLQKGKDKKLYRYTKPENQAGIATLSLPDDITWLYMPAFGKPKKISLLAKSQSFTGTDFSYEDMDSRSYSERYTPALIMSDDEEVFKLELTPKADKTEYSKIVLYLNKKHFYPEKMEYYNNHGDHFKTATYKYSRLNNYWYAEEVLMADHKQDRSTLIIMKDVKFDQGLTDDEFTVEKLKPEEPEK